ncbi:MAG TPA: glycosyltransferase, partial [Stellaceae bacterium]|nr:glycosyltransferase [Stellaceae bacterium]
MSVALADIHPARGTAARSDPVGWPHGDAKRIAIVTDAWHPQVNGVVRTLSAICDGLVAAGHETVVFGPDRFHTIPCPGYSTIRLAIGAGRRLGRQLAEFAPHAVHIATEGPLGFAARAFCLEHSWPFTTAYHTRFPEYVHARCGLPLAWS